MARNPHMSSVMIVVQLQANKALPIWQGHPWVFQKAVAKVSGKVKSGDLVQVVDAKNDCIGYGVYNDTSFVS